MHNEMDNSNPHSLTNHQSYHAKQLQLNTDVILQEKQKKHGHIFSDHNKIKWKELVILAMKTLSNTWQI